MNDLRNSPQDSVVEARQSGRITFIWLWRWFWRVALVVSVPYAFYVFYVPSNDIAWVADFATAQRQAEREDKPVILFFTGKWCVPCNFMKRRVWADDEVAATVNARLVPVTIDIDTTDMAALFDRYPVRVTPTTIVTDPQGVILQRVEGEISRLQFLEMLDKLSSTAESNAS